MWPSGYPQNNWEQLFAMQHYGIPTRLLDWSENLFTSAFFASTDHRVTDCECGTGTCKPTVWILDPAALNMKNSRLDGLGYAVKSTEDPLIDSWAPRVDPTIIAPDPIAIYGTHNSARIVAQQGTFTVQGQNLGPLEAAPAVTGNPDILTKIEIEMSHDELMEQLRKVGVRRVTVFPDLPSLASDLILEGF